MGKAFTQDYTFNQSEVRTILLHFVPKVEGAHKLEHGLGLAGIGELGVIEFSPVERIIRSLLEPLCNSIVFKFKHGGSGRGVAVKHLFQEEQDWRLVTGLQVHLYDS